MRILHVLVSGLVVADNFLALGVGVTVQHTQAVGTRPDPVGKRLML